MHSVRRAALRAALSASRVVCNQANSTRLATRTAAEWNYTRPALPHTLRFFSQTVRKAYENRELEQAQRKDEENFEKQAAADAREDVETEADIQEAMQEVSPSSSEEPGSPSSSEEPRPAPGAMSKAQEIQNSVFVRNLVFEVTEEHLQKAFSKYGEVASTFIARDPRGLSKGFGFVTFTTPEAVETACSQVNGSFWHGRRITCVRRTQPAPAGVKKPAKSPPGPTAQLFIGNIPYETTDAELNRLFRGIENLRDVRVAVDRTTGWPRGFAHADFTSIEAAIEAKKRLEGTMLGNRLLRVDFATGYQRRSRSPPQQQPVEDAETEQ
ncbi:uncharacterized protein THITE_2112338 [Thermothielavioides terrestris NRRL 8126]|uniref:RRM domain-containing protein n=1 Tax=Thermothielavioides terrestris (strain ATCC 38088 / NRRL 8126) TaxID=578455 RepID=G2QYL0_THETT|nr:uncharacterized protein THITE_2112338 [Thermothielavioides terrestris NRRL 8126]AEO65398.1 hypothetical protein THITE_2112338 [Thermothielavioides terrestris NRRL 8126]